ncbi:MAG: TasA family protein, partial [Acutalibacteraceae bacterium]|nr:TasA family protein [Acutalibacteraceae bacterium]
MNNTKTTKHALLSSVLAMLICVAMLIGTTFAWFTDSASTGVNKIQAGTLDVQLLDENGNSLEGQTLAWQKATGHESEEVLWEPG